MSLGKMYLHRTGFAQQGLHQSPLKQGMGTGGKVVLVTLNNKGTFIKRTPPHVILIATTHL